MAVCSETRLMEAGGGGFDCASCAPHGFTNNHPNPEARLMVLRTSSPTPGPPTQEGLQRVDGRPGRRLPPGCWDSPACKQNSVSMATQLSTPGRYPASQQSWLRRNGRVASRAKGGTMPARGRQLWLRLQKSFRRAVEKIKNEEMKLAHLSHGLQRMGRITLLHAVRHVTYDCLKKVFVVLDTESSLHLYKEDGFYVSSRRGPVAMMGLLYASQVDRFVAWLEGGLWVLDSGFKVLSEVQSALPISCGLYSQLLNRIVTAGQGNLAIWAFRGGYRSLHCCVTVSEGLGPGDVFSHLALDTSRTEPQRCFASCDTGAAAFDLSRGTLISFKTKLHSRTITDMVYCEVVGSPVTASRDTTIKVWDETWHIRTVFVGHTAPVIALAVDPERPLIFSASQDGTIRTWNLDTVDQVDQVHVSEPVEALETQTASLVISVSGASLTLWKINKLYSLYAPLGSPAKRLGCVDLTAVANFPVRVFCGCQDSTVRVLDEPTGTVLALLSLGPLFPVRDMAYCLPRETLFVLSEAGSLLRVNAATNPMVLKKVTAKPSLGAWPCCLLLYGHIVDAKKAYETWLEVVANKGERKVWQKPPLSIQGKNRYVLIMGQVDGLLSVVEWFSGRIQCQVEAHCSQRVTALAEYPPQTCIISAGADLTVKMWRVFPYAEESLVPLLCFSCAVPAVHLCCLRETVAVAFQDPETVTYSIVHYNLTEQTRCDHGPEDDPLDDITGLCCCPNLLLFASASRDGSVKIWNSQNQLLRHLKMNTIPESLAFANPQGDLLVGIERHLYLINHSKYLPSYYNMTLLCAKFLEPIQDTPLPMSQASFDNLVRDNVKRLKQDPSPEEAGSVPLPAAPQVSTQESQVRRGTQVEAKRSAELAELEIRNHDLLLLQKGSLCAAKKVRPTKATRAEAFEQYLRLFYKQQPKVKIPEEDFFDADEVLEAIGRCGSISELYGPNLSNMFLGAFPQLASLKAASEQLKDAGSSVGKALVVSSTIISATPLPGGREASLQLVQGGKKTSIQAEAAWLKPAPVAPSLPETQESLQLLQSLVPLAASPEALASSEKEAPRSPASSSATAPSSEERFLETWQKRRKRSSLPPEVKPEPPKPLSLPASLAASSILSAAAVDASKSEKSLSREEPALSKASRETHKHSKSSLHSRSQISSEVVKGFFPQPSLSREKTQSQTEPTGPLLPKLSSGFIPNSVVAQRLHITDLPCSAEALERVREAQEELQRGGSVKTAVQDQQPGTEPSTEKLIHLSWSDTTESATSVFLTQLSESQYSLTEAKTEEDISAFYSCFKDADWFKQLFPKRCPPGMGQIEFLARLLAAMATADFSTKTQLLEALLSLEEALGPDMRDMVFSTLIGLLNMKNGAPSMQEESEQRFILAALRALLILDKDSRDLMVELMSYYLQAPPLPRFAIEGLIEEVGVLDPHRYFYEEMDSWQVEEGSPKEEVRKVCSLWLEGAMQEFQEHRTLKHKPPPRHSCPHSPKAKVTHPRWRDTRSVRPVDAINHFAEKQLERQLADEVAELQEMPKDAVMVLPRIQKRQAILRLGETNAMLRNRIPEHGGFYFPYIIPRYFLKGFVPFVKLPLPKINLNPFPSRPERLVSPKTFTEKQQSVQKYFIPKFSYADSYP